MVVFSLQVNFHLLLDIVVVERVCAYVRACNVRVLVRSGYKVALECVLWLFFAALVQFL